MIDATLGRTVPRTDNKPTGSGRRFERQLRLRAGEALRIDQHFVEVLQDGWQAQLVVCGPEVNAFIDCLPGGVHRIGGAELVIAAIGHPLKIIIRAAAPPRVVQVSR